MSAHRIKAKITITVPFVGEVLDEYLEHLGDHDDTYKAREWFILDRFIGHDNLGVFDKDVAVKYGERISEF